MSTTPSARQTRARIAGELERGSSESDGFRWWAWADSNSRPHPYQQQHFRLHKASRALRDFLAFCSHPTCAPPKRQIKRPPKLDLSFPDSASPVKSLMSADADDALITAHVPVDNRCYVPIPEPFFSCRAGMDRSDKPQRADRVILIKCHRPTSTDETNGLGACVSDGDTQIDTDASAHVA